MNAATPRLYDDLAYLWPLMSPPEDYADEGERWRRELRARLGPGRIRFLDLGTGGGHHLHQIIGGEGDRFDAAAVDLSETMLGHSRRLNPGVSHHVGDMRSVRLDETFDAVLIHDAISYMTTEADLLAAFATARAHLRPGGLLLAAPDDYAETFDPPRVRHETRRAAGRELTYVECSTDADPTDTRAETAKELTYVECSTDADPTDTRAETAKELTYVEYSTDADPTDTRAETAYVFFLNEGGELRVEVDQHVTGLFPIAAWERLLREAGFASQRVDYPYADDDRPMFLWVCALRA